jgi:hypothetical protein
VAGEFGRDTSGLDEDAAHGRFRPCPVPPPRPTGPSTRSADTATIEAVPPHRLRHLVEQSPTATAGFRHNGRAYLVSQYVFPIAFRVPSALRGCPDPTGALVADGIARIFDATATAAEQGNQVPGQAVADLVTLRRHQPTDNIHTRLPDHQPVVLSVNR